MPMLMQILIGLAVVLAIVVAFAVIVVLRPSHFEVERSVEIAASAAVVFDQVNDFHKWEAFSPWAKMDPAAKNTYSGPPVGTGAEFAWAGNSRVGQGRMAITESHPHDLIRIKLEFIKPFPGLCDVAFRIQPKGQQTAVTWSIAGEHTFLPKAFGLFVSMDRMIGGSFEKGLADLKAVSEAIPNHAAPADA